jgi:hypothetical protein
MEIAGSVVIAGSNSTTRKYLPESLAPLLSPAFLKKIRCQNRKTEYLMRLD